MPTKALLYAAEVRHLAQYGGLWGMKPGDVPFDWSAVMARKDGLIKEFADYRAQQLNNGKFQFIRALARFTGPHTLALDNGQTLAAKDFAGSHLRGSSEGYAGTKTYSANDVDAGTGCLSSEEAGMLEMAQWIKGFVPEVPVQLVTAREPFWAPA